MATYTNADLQEALAILADYCPAACIEFARVCRAGQRQHNGGVPGLFHDRSKSPENFEKGIGHWSRRGRADDDGTLHVAKAFWRAGIDCQLECELRGAPLAPAARNLPPPGPVPEGVAAAYLRDVAESDDPEPHDGRHHAAFAPMPPYDAHPFNPVNQNDEE